MGRNVNLKTNHKNEMKKVFVMLAVLVAGIVATSCACESFKRDIKSLKSDFGGGLYRTVTLMDYQGDTLKQWTGKFEVRDAGADNQVYFDINGKRVWIQGGIVVNEEW